MAPGRLGSSSDAKAWRRPPAFLNDPSKRGRRFLGARIQPLGRGQKNNVLNLTLPWPRGGVCLEVELLRQMHTGLGVPGLPQRLGEGRRPQDDLSPEWRPSGNRPSLTWPSSHQGNPGKVMSTPGLRAASGQGLARRPCNPGLHPLPCREPPLAPGGWSRRPSEQHELAGQCPLNTTQSWGKSPHVTPPSPAPTRPDAHDFPE